jgi:hypothetical protein
MQKKDAAVKIYFDIVYRGNHDKRYSARQQYTGETTNVQKYGCLVRIDGGVHRRYLIVAAKKRYNYGKNDINQIECEKKWCGGRTALVFPPERKYTAPQK